MPPDWWFQTETTSQELCKLRVAIGTLGAGAAGGAIGSPVSVTDGVALSFRVVAVPLAPAQATPAATSIAAAMTPYFTFICYPLHVEP
ncbi:hypothetical protein [Streptomyces sp. NPDC039028]|uniref:hypothetical protein n=1 Tax=unclassified Streptomyces TaxID=2593676 RepID=UPI0033F5C785